MTPYTDGYQLPFPLEALGSRYGVVDSEHRSPHRGVDFIVAEGKAIHAVATGVIVFVGWSNALGRVTVSRTKLRRLRNGQHPMLYVGYAHQSRQDVKPGMMISRNTVIGRIGGAIVNDKHTSGYASSGSHLHLTMSFESEGVFHGTTFDPLEWILKYSV